MANRNFRNDRDRYDRERGETRQAEQFEPYDYGWREDERGLGQMGEGSWREDERGYEARQPYDRTSDFSRDRSYRRGGDFGAGEPSAYSSSRHGHGHYASRQGPSFASFTGSDQGGRDFTAPRHTGGRSYSGTEGGYGASLARSGSDWRDEDNDRGWMARAGDEVASWFGDEEAARRREQDHRGKGPSGYVRSDERIQDDANDRLTDDWRVDAANIQVSVSGGELTLDGTVNSRNQKRRAEDCVEDISGVKHVQNNLRVQQTAEWDRNAARTETGS